MEEYVENLQGMADEYEKRPAWDKLGEDDPSNKENCLEEYFNPEGSKQRKQEYYWSTTNMEYGRFQALRDQEAQAQRTAAQTRVSVPTASAINRSLGALGIRPGSGRDPGASARSRADDVAREDAERTQSRASAISRGSTACQSFEERRMKYLPLRGSNPNQDSDAERRRLTTGYAKGYMTNNHPRFYDNVKTVAKDAGFNTPGNTRPNTQSHSQVLNVENDGDIFNTYNTDAAEEDFYKVYASDPAQEEDTFKGYDSDPTKDDIYKEYGLGSNPGSAVRAV